MLTSPGDNPCHDSGSGRTALCQRRRRAEYARTAVELLQSHSAEAGVRLAYLLNAALESEVTWRTYGAALAHVAVFRLSIQVRLIGGDNDFLLDL